MHDEQFNETKNKYNRNRVCFECLCNVTLLLQTAGCCPNGAQRSSFMPVSMLPAIATMVAK